MHELIKKIGKLSYPESFPSTVDQCHWILSRSGTSSLADQDQRTVSKRLAKATGLHFYSRNCIGNLSKSSFSDPWAIKSVGMIQIKGQIV